MKKSNIALLLIAAILLVSAIASAEYRASNIITRSTATLLSNKTAQFSVVAKMDCESIGTVRYTLFRSNGSIVKSETINDYSSNYYRHTTTVDLYSYIQNGNSYYIIAYFYADGATSNVTSGTRTY